MEGKAITNSRWYGIARVACSRYIPISLPFDPMGPFPSLPVLDGVCGFGSDIGSARVIYCSRIQPPGRGM